MHQRGIGRIYWATTGDGHALNQVARTDKYVRITLNELMCMGYPSLFGDAGSAEVAIA